MHSTQTFTVCFGFGAALLAVVALAKDESFLNRHAWPWIVAGVGCLMAAPSFMRLKHIQAEDFNERDSRVEASLRGGFRFVLPLVATVKTEEMAEAIEELLVKNFDKSVEDRSGGIFRVLACSGLSTIGFAPGDATTRHSGLRLYERLAEWQGSIEILLLDPCCFEARQRALLLGLNKDRYRLEIVRMLGQLGLLQRDHNPNLSVRLYRDAPIWKLVAAKDRMLVIPSVSVKPNPSGDLLFAHSDLYVIETNGSAVAGLHTGFNAVWKRRWRLGKEISPCLGGLGLEDDLSSEQKEGLLRLFPNSLSVAHDDLD